MYLDKSFVNQMASHGISNRDIHSLSLKSLNYQNIK